MDRRIWLGAVAVASLMLTGCTGPDQSAAPTPPASHSMPDGQEMTGSEHGAHGAEHGSHGAEPASSEGPSEAARMVCEGRVPGSVADVLGVEGAVTPLASWNEPVFTCTYEIEGAPLTLSVHDAPDVAEGTKHFAELRKRFSSAEDIAGMAALGMPSFATGDGVVAFMREGKTLLVDATALPNGLGADGTRTQAQAAYALASAVLACWVEHD